MAFSITKIVELFFYKIKQKYYTLKSLRNVKKHNVIIFFFPDYSFKNPHQSLLKKEFPDEYHYISGNITQALGYIKKHPNSRVVFHLHWPDKILKEANYRKFLEQIEQFKLYGGKVLWTIHNLLPHNYNMELNIIEKQNKLFKCSDLIHFFTESSMLRAQELFSIENYKCFISMRGNYLELNNNEFVERTPKELSAKINILFFGQIKKYKNVDSLVDVFNKLNKIHKNARLTICGEIKISKKDANDLKQKIAINSNITLINNYINNADIPTLMNNAEIVVFPYSNITNSGSILLTLGFSKCIVAPDMNAVKDLLTDNVNAILYNPDARSNNLYNGIERALKLNSIDRNLIGENGYNFVKTLNWKKNAQEICSKIDTLF